MKRLNYIDGLKGWCAVSVCVLHFLLMFSIDDDGTKVPSPRLFTLLSEIPGIRDIQMETEDIEKIIANLYRKWSAETEKTGT